jgi:hypothetical protein
MGERFYTVESSYIRDRKTGKLYDKWNEDDIAELNKLRSDDNVESD